MSWILLILLIVGVTSGTLLGSLYSRRYGKPDLLIGLYVAFILTAQMLATKISLFTVGPWHFTAPAGVLVFSVTFLLLDIVNERFGRKATQSMITIAFVSQVAMAFFLWLGTQFHAAPEWAARGELWDSLFSLVPQITVASWIAFFISENIDAYIYAWFRRMTAGRHLWMRNVFSTLPALVVDSCIFVSVAFWGVVPFSMMILVIKGQIVLKWLVGLINVPFMYLNYAILRHKSDLSKHVVWHGDAPE